MSSRAVVGARLGALLAAVACGAGARGAPDAAPVAPTPARLRAERRAYDGAPPIVPHRPVGAPCTACHGDAAIAVPGLGVAPPSPHEGTAGMSAASRCPQCHVYAATAALFRANAFVGLPQDLRRGSRLYPHAPPVIPHGLFMRERCVACHDGPAARAEIRTSHPTRARCRQCHVPAVTRGDFARP